MDNSITVRQGICKIVLHLPSLTSMTQRNFRKLCKMVLMDPYTNRDAIDKLTRYLEIALKDSKEEWHQASIQYQREWRFIDKPAHRRTKVEVQATAKVKQHNEELTKACKRTKAQYERWVKYKSIWEEAQQ